MLLVRNRIVSEKRFYCAPKHMFDKIKTNLILIILEVKGFQGGTSLVGHLCFCVSHAFASVHCCLEVTCWERADRLALYCIFVTFPCGILGQVWYFIASFPDLCRLSYFYIFYVYLFIVRTIDNSKVNSSPQDFEFTRLIPYT